MTTWTLRIDLEGCYGIKSFRADLELSGEKRHAAIYAPNGTMKTSLARTFEDLGPKDDPNRTRSADRVFPSVPYKRLIEYVCDAGDPDDAGQTSRSLNSDDVLVLRPREDNLDMAEAASKILVSEDLRRKRSAVYKGVAGRKDALLKWLEGKSGLAAKAIRGRIIEDFDGDAKKVEQFLEIIDKNSDLVWDDFSHYDGIKYNDIFNSKVMAVIECDEFKSLADKYVEKYRQLVEKSPYFTMDFDHDRAMTAKKRLVATNFFKAGHRVTLVPGAAAPGAAAPGAAAPGAAAPKEIDDEESFQKAIESELERIDEGTGLEWEQIDKILSKNAETQSLRRILAGNAKLLEDLKDPAAARQSLWKSYLSAEGSPYEDLVSAYRDCKDDLGEIDRRAGKEATLWDDVVDQFNKRFKMPVELRVANRSHALLDGEVAALEFLFSDNGQKRPITYAELSSILSEGEKRALYMLYGLFKIEKRKMDNKKTLVVVDDVADSFDYKNKHAIVQYLYEIADMQIFSLMILTHNFDFFRNINLRIVDYSQCYYAVKDGNSIRLKNAQWVRGPLNDITNNLSKQANLIAAVSFARNIRGHSHGVDDDRYGMLSSVLHYRANTYTITVGDVLGALKEIFPKKSKTIGRLKVDVTQKMTEYVGCEAAKIAANPSCMLLAEKIALSVYTRVAAERFMSERIYGEDLPARPPGTCDLVKKYRKDVGSGDAKTLDTLDRVCLASSEVIHINSFMYEPILDMSGQYLSELYKDVKKLGEGAGGK